MELYLKILESKIGAVWRGGCEGRQIWDEVFKLCGTYHKQPAHSLAELRAPSKVKGDMFEALAFLYLKHVMGLAEVWFLKNLPKVHREALALGHCDLGIDLVGRQDGKWFAVQAKFRQRKGTRRVVVPWKDLATFYALVPLKNMSCLHQLIRSAMWDAKRPRI